MIFSITHTHTHMHEANLVTASFYDSVEASNSWFLDTVAGFEQRTEQFNVITISVNGKTVVASPAAEIQCFGRTSHSVLLDLLKGEIVCQLKL